MSKRTRAWIQLIFWLIVLVGVFWKPGIAIIVAIAGGIYLLYQATKNIPIGKIRRRK